MLNDQYNNNNMSDVINSQARWTIKQPAMEQLLKAICFAIKFNMRRYD